MEKITPKSLNKAKEDFVTGNKGIRTISFSTKKAIKEIGYINMLWEKIETYVTLCPFYDRETWWIKWDYKNFEDVNQRYKDKFSASLDVLDFLEQQEINTKVNFLLADIWIIINDEYNQNRFKDDILWITNLYKEEISKRLDNYNFIKFSDFWINWQTLCNVSEEKTTQDTIKILEKFWVNTKNFKFSLEIIEKSFWITGAYYLIKSYLEETEQLSKLLKKSIFINTEATWPLNSLYTAWKTKLDIENLLIRVKI